MNNDEVTEKTLLELQIIAFTTIDDFLTPGTFRLKNKGDIPLEKWIAIKELNVSSKGISIKMHDKTKALSALADYLGILNEFNCAIATLRKYGLFISRNENGKWTVSENG